MDNSLLTIETSKAVHPGPILGVFLTVAISSLFPIPEEIMLITIGVSSSFAGLNIFFVIFASILGIMFADNFWFFAGRSNNPLFKWLKSKLQGEKIEKYKTLIKENSGKAVFITRFIPGMRIILFFLSGFMHVKRKTFWIFESIAALIYVPVLICLGYFFHQGLTALTEDIKTISWIVIVVLLMSGITVHFIFARKK